MLTSNTFHHNLKTGTYDKGGISMKTLIIILILHLLAAADVGPEGYKLGSYLDPQAKIPTHLQVFTREPDRMIIKVISTRAAGNIQGHIDYLEEEYGTYKDDSDNYERGTHLIWEFNEAVVLLNERGTLVKITYEIKD